MRDIVNEGKSTEVDQPQYVDNDLARAEELLQVQKYISNEEFNELNELRQQITEYDAILEYLEKIKAENIDITKEQANINYSEASKAYQNEINAKNKILALTKKINIVEKTDDKKKDIASLQNYIQLLENKAVNQNDINNLKLIENSLDKDGKLSQEQINQLEEIENKNIIQLNQEMIKRLALAKAITVAENGTQEEIQEAYNKYLAIYNTKIDNNKRKGEITDLIQGLSTVTSLLTSISGIVKTLNDDDLSFGEKAEQVISVLLMNLPMLLMNLNSLKNLLPAIAGATNKAAIAMGAEGVTAASGFGTSLMGIISIAGPYVLAIGAVIGVVYALVKAYNADADAAREAKKQAEELKNEYESIKESYQNVLDTVSDYTESLNALKKLEKGTLEWKQAVLELNEQVLNLIDKYPELAKFVTSQDGVLGLTQQGVNSLLQNQWNIVQSAYQASNYANVRSNNADLKLAKTNFQRSFTYQAQREIGTTAQPFSSYNQNNPFSSQNSITKNITQEEINKLINALDKNGLSILENEETLKKATGFNDNLTKALIDNRSAVENLNTAVINNTNSNQVLQTSILQSKLSQQSGGFNKLSSGDQERIVKALTPEVEKARARLEKSNKFDNISDDELHEQYADLMGYNKDQIKDKWGKAIFKDINNENVEVKDSLMREILAQNAALKIH